MNEEKIIVSEWYALNRSKYSSLTENVTNLIKTLLALNHISYYNLQSRVKEFESFGRKVWKKGFPYVDPTDIEDLAGIRIIAYLISEVDEISNIIRSSFNIIEFEDKSKELGVDRVGYNSIHIIATLSKEREVLPEYAHLKDLKFEIQIKTILQHTWAEIEHDRIYKFEEEVPAGIPRRFRRLSGMLEEIDVTFQEMSNIIEQYSKETLSRIQKGDFDIPINATTLKQYIVTKFGDLPNVSPRYGVTGTERILEELDSMGIRTLSDLEATIDPKIRSAYDKQGKYSGLKENITSLVRHILMVSDTRSYFEKGWNNHFQTIDPVALELLKESGANIQEIRKHLEVSTQGFG